MQSDSPFAPGESPYHVKGVVYAGTHKYFAKQVQGGLDALWTELAGDPPLLAFMQQKFLASGWYDVLPVAALIRAEARALRLSVPHYLRKRSEFQAKDDIGGVYRFLLKMISPESVANRLPRLLTQIFDFGTNEINAIDNEHIEATLTGFPMMLWPWYSTAFEVYSETLLSLAGGKQVSSFVRDAQRIASDRGVDLCKFQILCRWS